MAEIGGLSVGVGDPSRGGFFGEAGEGPEIGLTLETVGHTEGALFSDSKRVN